MLRLASQTDPAWAERAYTELEELLLDHAHCEKKAAGTAIKLLFRYPHHTFLVEPLSKLAREELLHFEQLIALLRARGFAFRPQRPSPYAGRLFQAARRQEPERLLDTLLCCALIEGRSCERFQLLSDAAPDAKLKQLFGGLLECEARHHGSYVELADRLMGDPACVRSRLDELALHEADVIAQAPSLVRLHN